MRLSTVVTLALVLAGTVRLGKIPPVFAGESSDSPAPLSANPPGDGLAVASDYVIGPADVLRISVWQEPQFGETVEVRPDGKISLPLVSDILVSGLTPSAAEAKLTDALLSFVKHPRVSVVVMEVRSKTVYVIGEVQHPGPYPMFQPINVEQLIARAGGITRRANSKHVYVLRAGSGTKLAVNYKKLLEGNRKAEDPPLNPGDTVVVP